MGLRSWLVGALGGVDEEEHKEEVQALQEQVGRLEDDLEEAGEDLHALENERDLVTDLLRDLAGDRSKLNVIMELTDEYLQSDDATPPSDSLLDVVKALERELNAVIENLTAHDDLADDVQTTQEAIDDCIDELNANVDGKDDTDAVIADKVADAASLDYPEADGLEDKLRVFQTKKDALESKVDSLQAHREQIQNVHSGDSRLLRELKRVASKVSDHFDGLEDKVPRARELAAQGDDVSDVRNDIEHDYEELQKHVGRLRSLLDDELNNVAAMDFNMNRLNAIRGDVEEALQAKEDLITSRRSLVKDLQAARAKDELGVRQVTKTASRLEEAVGGLVTASKTVERKTDLMDSHRTCVVNGVRLLINHPGYVDATSPRYGKGRVLEGDLYEGSDALYNAYHEFMVRLDEFEEALRDDDLEDPEAFPNALWAHIEVCQDTATKMREIMEDYPLHVKWEGTSASMVESTPKIAFGNLEDDEYKQRRVYTLGFREPRNLNTEDNVLAMLRDLLESIDQATDRMLIRG